MNSKTIKISYYITTGLLSVFMLLSAGMYFFKHAMVAASFTSLGYPTYIICPLATVKILGVIVLWNKKWKSLNEWAYAGFFFDFVLAFFAHTYIGDGKFVPAVVAIVLLLTSYFLGKRIQGN